MSNYNVFKDAKDYAGSKERDYAIPGKEFINIKDGVIRIWNSDIGQHCDIQIRGNRGLLDTAFLYPGLFKVHAAAAEKAKVDAELKEPFEGVGKYRTGVIYGDLIPPAQQTPARKNSNYVGISDTGPRQVTYRISDPIPELEEDKDIPKGGIIFFQTANDKGGVMLGNGRGDEVVIGDGVRTYAQNGPVTFDRENANYGSNTNSHNFLQHYLIPLAQAAGLPLMPHLFNIPKYITIGLFVKNIAEAVKAAVVNVRKEF